jgi:ppGpp synthetase/RelA/SpoT-type nucleotidyltranferase
MLSDKIRNLHGKHDGLDLKLKIEICKILQNKDVEFVLVESRRKKIGSLSKKVARRTQSDSEYIPTDITGLRVVLRLNTDLIRVQNIFINYFEFDLENHVQKSDNYSANEFGYLSNHYIVRLNEGKFPQDDWKRYYGLNIEIQMRSVLQHAWSVNQHELYKRPSLVTSDIVKRYSRLAALFEMADNEFNEINKIINPSLCKGSSNDLNFLTLKSFIFFESITFKRFKKFFLVNNGEKSTVSYGNPNLMFVIAIACKSLDIKTLTGLEEYFKNDFKSKMLYFKNLVKGNFLGKNGLHVEDSLAFFVMISLVKNLNEEEYEEVSKTDKNYFSHLKQIIY